MVGGGGGDSCLEGRKDLAYVLLPGISLRTAAICECIFLTIWGCLDLALVAALAAVDEWDWQFSLPLLLGVAKISLAAVGVVCLRVAAMGGVQALLLRVAIFAVIASFVVQLAFWLVDLKTSWDSQPGGLETMQLIVLILGSIMFLATAPIMISAFRSLGAVLKAGGRGNEFRDYRDLMLGGRSSNGGPAGSNGGPAGSNGGPAGSNGGPAGSGGGPAGSAAAFV